MVTEIILPVLGETVNESTIAEWFKAEGDPIRRGEPLFSVESDKAVLEVEAPASGFLRKILVPAGQKVPVLTVVALMTTSADEPLAERAVADKASRVVGGEPERRDTGPWTPDAGPGDRGDRPAGRILASPRARKAAQERGIALELVRGSGPDGRIEERDVLAFVAAQQPGPPAPRATPVALRTAEALGVDLSRVAGTGTGGKITRADVEAAGARIREAESMGQTPPTEVGEPMPLSGLRRIIAERMAASHQAVARVTLVTEADATALVELRGRLKAAVEAEWGLAPGYTELLGLIVARALREFPYMNACLAADGQAIEHLPAVNLGMAVDTGRGLLVPVIRNADQKGLRAFSAEFRALVERARAGRATPEDLSGGTFTLTNLGMYEVDAFTPIVNLPEAAILGTGRILPKAVVHGGEIVVRQMWTLSLSFDHRLVDGAPAARFLQHIKRRIEEPYLLLE